MLPFNVNTFDSVTFAQVKSDGLDVGFYAGYLLFGFRGVGPDWRRDELDFILPEPAPLPGVPAFPPGPATKPSNWQRVDAVVPVIALATMANDGGAYDAGWAIDDCRWTTGPAGPPGMSNIQLKGQVAARDTDGYILRLAYHVTVIGRKQP